jgi:L-aspartate oxidase
METDVLIVGCGCSGLYCALNLPRDKRILMITSSDAESSDSYLAQGGMCMLKDEVIMTVILRIHLKQDIMRMIRNQ